MYFECGVSAKLPFWVLFHLIFPQQRLCEQCDSEEVEDEIHFLLCCSKFREERQQLFRTISQSCNNFLQLNPQEIFYWLRRKLISSSTSPESHCPHNLWCGGIPWYLPVSICRRYAEILSLVKHLLYSKLPITDKYKN
jgi:hypothetical protein